MFSWFYKLLGRTLAAPKPKEEWRLVHTHTVKIDQTQPDRTKIPGKFYYHLSESSFGNRKCTYGATFAMTDMQLEMSGKKFDDYHEVVYPWLSGRYIKDIPRFDDVPQIDVMAKLSS